MPYDPMEGFQIGQAIGKSKRSSLSRTSDYMSDLSKERDKEGGELDKLFKSELLKSMITSPKEQAMTDYYKASTKALGGQSNPQDVSSLASQAGYSEEDYILNPTVTRYKGQMKVENAPQLKPPLDPKSTTEIGAFRRTRQNLQNNLSMINPGVEKRMSPFSFSASRLPGSNMALKAQGMMGDKSANDFSTFKAETDKVFQQFRKETTGAQAALKELGWLEPDYPMPSDPPDLYRQKANEAMRRLEEGENLLLDLYSQRGFRVGELRQGMNTIQQAASNQSSVPNKISPEDALAELRRRGRNV